MEKENSAVRDRFKKAADSNSEHCYQSNPERSQVRFEPGRGLGKGKRDPEGACEFPFVILLARKGAAHSRPLDTAHSGPITLPIAFTATARRDRYWLRALCWNR